MLRVSPRRSPSQQYPVTHIIEIALAIIVLGWLNKKRESQKTDDLSVLVTCQSNTLAAFSCNINSPVAREST